MVLSQTYNLLSVKPYNMYRFVQNLVTQCKVLIMFSEIFVVLSGMR